MRGGYHIIKTTRYKEIDCYLLKIWRLYAYLKTIKITNVKSK